MLNLYIYLYFAFYFSVGENFLPLVLNTKLKSSVYPTSNKLWMKYLQKKLETLNLQLQKMYCCISFLEAYRRNYRQKIFEVTTSCNKIGGIETMIYGNICGTSKRGVNEEYPLQDNIFIDTLLPGMS